jgi:hypothetical protein
MLAVHPGDLTVMLLARQNQAVVNPRPARTMSGRNTDCLTIDQTSQHFRKDIHQQHVPSVDRRDMLYTTLTLT